MIGTIMHVVEKVEKHRALYEGNEEAVKQHLIGEIFSALGWEWSNPHEVRPEYRTEEGRADYALILDGKVVAYVEAKNLGVDLFKKINPLHQLGKYCFSQGVSYGILTNGVQWVVIKAFEEGTPIEERVLFRVNLEGEPPTKSALKLSLLSKDNIVNLGTLGSYLKSLEESFKGLRKAGFSEEVLINYLKTLTSPPREFWRGITRLKNVKSHTQRPKSLYVYEGFWRRLDFEGESWRGAFRAVVRYILENRELESGERKELETVFKYMDRLGIDSPRAFLLLKEVEDYFGLDIGVEF